VRPCGPHGPAPAALRGRPSSCGRVRRQGEAPFSHHQPLPISLSLSTFSSVRSGRIGSDSYTFWLAMLRSTGAQSCEAYVVLLSVESSCVVLPIP
jgi:hypothetical protein